MNYVLATNILVHILTGSNIGVVVNAKIQESNPYFVISIVTKAEITSLAKQ